jgi:hypothetical protein
MEQVKPSQLLPSSEIIPFNYPIPIHSIRSMRLHSFTGEQEEIMVLLPF